MGKGEDMDAIYQWMKELTYFMLFLGFIRNLTGKKYEKYARLTVGLCTVALLIKPISGLLSDKDFSGILERHSFAFELEEESMADSALDSRILEEYKDRLLVQISEIVKPWGYQPTGLELDIQQGVWNGFTVCLARIKDEEHEYEDQERKIERISISEIVIRTDTEQKSAQEEAAFLMRQEEITRALAQYYRLETEQIHIKMEGDYGGVEK